MHSPIAPAHHRSPAFQARFDSFRAFRYSIPLFRGAWRKCLATAAVLAAVTLAVSLSARAASIVWGIGDTLGGAKTTALYADTPLKMVTQWYNGPQDMNYIRGYYNNATVSNLYGQGYGIELIVWLADAPADYPIGSQFQADLQELIEIMRGQGPHCGPLYVVMFTEIETMPIPQGYADWSAYRVALKAAYMTSLNTIRNAYSNSHVGLGFGLYGWSSTYGTDRDLAFWDDALNASDFTCTQAMTSCTSNMTAFANRIRNAVRQLGDYGKPVIISHFKVWGNETYPDGTPRPDEQPDDQRAAFNSFMSNLFTDTSLNNLVDDGLFGWAFMIDYYCKPPVSGHADYPNPGTAIYNALDSFITNHNLGNPWFVGINPPPATVCEVEDIATVVSSNSITNFSETAASMGVGEKFNAVLNGYVTYTLPVPAAGTYTIRVRTKRSTDRGIYKLDIDGANYVTNKDTYNAAQDYVIQNLPAKTFTTAGNKEFKFTVTGKNGGSSGYALALDCIQLVPVVWEAETIPNAEVTDAVTVFYEGAASGGAAEKLESDAVNDYIAYTVPIWKTGTYSIKVRVKKHPSRGKFQLSILSITEANQGSVQDLYNASDAYALIDLGTKTFNAIGNKQFKFKVTGKNASSSGYTLALDYIELTPQ